MKRTVRILSASVLAIVMGCTSVAMAQNALRPYADRDAEWWDNLELQLSEALKSPIEQVKVQTIRHIIFFSATYPDMAHMDRTVPQLLELYDTSDKEGLRVLSLAAIDAIGNDYAMRYLISRVEQEKSERVQRLTKAVLADYYKAKNGRDAG